MSLAIGRRHRRQKALLFPFLSYDDNGDEEVGPPEEILVRWVESESDASSFAATAVVADDLIVDVGSLLWLAPDQSAGSDTALIQWYGSGSAGPDTGLMQVDNVKWTPNMKHRFFRNTLQLVRYKDAVKYAP